MEGYLFTFLWSMSPVLELRAAIPLGYLQFGLTIWEASIVAIIGNFLAGTIVLSLLPSFIKLCEKHSAFLHKIAQKILRYTHKKHSHKMEVVGEIALILFVAIPLPGSGAWTGALVAYLFGIPYKKALALIFVGIVISGIVVSSIIFSGSSLWASLTESAQAVAP